MSRTTVLRRTRTVAAASLIAAAAFSLTACGGDAKAGSSSATAGGAGEDLVTNAGSASSDSASASRCTTHNLKASWSNFEGGPDMDYDEQQTARVVLKNTGTTDCAMVGFPGVQLRTADGSTWDLGRSSKKPETVRIGAGETAGFDITILASTRDDDRKFELTQVVVTPPNEREHLVLDWPFGGALLDQSGATHPGTYVNPVNTVE